MSSVTHRNALKPGFKFQWYVIERVLGQGGFGITYLALDTNLDQHVAIKEYLPSDLATRDEDSSVTPLSNECDDRYHWGLDRFISEARTLARFKHPNIVRVYNVFDMNNTAYMTMEYEQGDSLQDIFTNKKTLSQDELMNILLPILDGLEQVHSQGFIHRDIKPANIFIRKDQTPVLLDFGSARMALGKKTVTLTSIITPGYAPFEQYYSKSDRQGPWTDIYSLGATLYRGMTGKAPMNAVDRSEAILKTSKDIFVYTSQWDTKRYTPAFLNAVDHALQFNENDRPQSIKEWLGDFAPLTGKAKAETVSRPSRATESTTLVAKPSGRERSKPVPAKIKLDVVIPAVLVSALIIIILVAGFLAYQYMATGVEPPASVVEQAAPPLPAVVAPHVEPASAQKTELLEKARQALAQGNLVTPPVDNAYDYFLQVLKIDNSDPAARNGIRDVIAALVTRAENALSQNNLELTETIIGQLEVIAPNNPSLASLQQQLKDKKTIALLQAGQQEKIATLLARAEKKLKDMQLIEPENNNAYYHYQQVLALEPQNQDALQGIGKITETLILLARQAMNDGNTTAAGKYLDTAKKISPDNEEISTATAQLNTLKTTMAQKEEGERKLELARAETQKQEEAKRLAEEEKLRARQEAAEQKQVTAQTPETTSPVAATPPAQPVVQEAMVPPSRPKALLILSIPKNEYESLGLSIDKLRNQITDKLSAAGWETVTDNAPVDAPNVKQFSVKASFVFSSFGPSSYSVSVYVRSKLPGPENGKLFTDKGMWTDGNTGQFIPGTNTEIEQLILKLIDKYLSGTRT